MNFGANKKKILLCYGWGFFLAFIYQIFNPFIYPMCCVGLIDGFVLLVVFALISVILAIPFALVIFVLYSLFEKKS